jgi:Domain of Unknown Function (DUF1080)
MLKTTKTTILAALLPTAAIAIAALLSSCACPCCGKSDTALFNGKDLNGWTHVLADPAVPREKVWTVQDGILVCKGEPVGFLYSAKSYGDFVLTVEYRWAPGTKPGNSGIFTRIQRPSPALPITVETQLAHGSAGDLLGLQGLKFTTGQPRFFHVDKHPLAGDIDGVKKTDNAELPPGEWNTVVVDARGPLYRITVNGRLVNEVNGVLAGPGPVGLQSEGGEIHFRRVQIRPL